MDVVLPIRVVAPGKVLGPLPTSPYGPARMAQEQAAVLAQVHYEHRWGPNYRPGFAPPLDWLTSDDQGHLVTHSLRNLPAITVLGERRVHRIVWLSTQCLLCGSSSETACHL